MSKIKKAFSKADGYLFPNGRKDREFKSWDRDNNGYPLEDEQVKKLIAVRPTPLQAEFSDLEFYTFIHFGMNTFTGVEWGTGKESPSQFCPEKIDTDQWARVIKKSGSRGVIFTAKHHDGFCLFQTAYTEHSIKNSLYKNGKGDIVRELSESCKKEGLLFGIYLSPWDMHEKTYGTKAYDDYFVNQLTELCENYGEIFNFWFDGARGKNAPNFVYDFERYYKVIHEKQPKAAICNCGPDVRWIGNEAGVVRESEWSVIAGYNVAVEKVMAASQQGADDTVKLREIDFQAKDLGSREVLRGRDDLRWSPGEADVSIHLDWFHSPKPRPRSAKELEKIYFRTVGGNALLLLNVPPSKNGVIEDYDVKLLEDFKARVDKEFKNPIAFEAFTEGGREIPSVKTEDGGEALRKGDGALVLKLAEPKKIRTLVLREDITQSQRIERFEVFFKAKKGFRKVFSGTTVGSKKIALFPSSLQNVTDEVRIYITQSRSNPVIRSVSLFGE